MPPVRESGRGEFLSSGSREVLEHPGVPRTPTLSCRGGGVWGATFRKGKIQKIEKKKRKYLRA